MSFRQYSLEEIEAVHQYQSDQKIFEERFGADAKRRKGMTM